MQMKYNISIELASVIFVAILCIYQEVQYSNKQEANRAFKRMAWTVLSALCMDIVTAVTISYAAMIPNWMNIILNTVYFELDALIAFFFVLYIAVHVYKQEERKSFLRLNYVIQAAYLCLLLMNMAAGWIFSFSDTNEYIHGPIYMIVYILPLYYLLFSIGILISKWAAFQRRQRFSIIFFEGFIVVGMALQFLFFPHVLLSVFAISVGLVVLQYSLETPDYQRLMNTMKELEHAKEDALEANRAKGEFLSNMSHELRTPINAILGFNEIILKETQESLMAECAWKVQSTGRALLSVVNDILDFTSIDKGELKLEIEPYDTLSWLQDIISYARFSGEKKGLECRISIDENIPQQLSGDMVRLTQIVNNLISNAVKFTQEGSIELSAIWQAVDENSGKLCVQVNDSGIGMRPEDVEELNNLEKTEKSFLRYDNRKTRDKQGIGLGLTIVTRLLSLMESHLNLQSIYGEGTEASFEVKQDIVSHEPIGKFKDTFGIPEASYRNKKTAWLAPDVRLLAVDDNAMNLDMFTGLLKHTKIQIDTATNGEEALKLLEENSYDLVFLDHMMPVLDGIETLQEIRKRNLCPDTPVIALTANAVAGAKGHYLEVGFENYLSKPVKGVELEKMIQEYCSQKLYINGEDEGVTEDAVLQTSSEDDFLSRLSFLDTATGMTYCCDSEDFYREMLSSYMKNQRKEELEQDFEQEDWENYRIAVHALKSTSLSIGAVSVSEQAKALEMAAKAEDHDFIRENHGQLITDYQKLLTRLDEALNIQETVSQTKEVVERRMHIPYIYAVDDDPTNLWVIEKMLKEEFTVACFDSGEKLLQALESEIPDMILLDVRMPGMDGFEVLKRLKQNEDYREIPIIFLTADEERDTEIEGFKNGVNDFIHKPFIVEIVIQRVKRILQMDRLQKDLQSEVEKQTKEIIEQKNQVERLNEEIIMTLVGAIDAKDTYTNGHSKRVAEYARAIAKRLGRSESELSDIYVSGLLHDVGKIGIPDTIINKPDKLTDEEYAVIKTHPAIGATILNNISAISDIATGAHWHHERYDGRGYPDGLTGTEIPEIARIIGVADAYDAMTSKRSYRSVLPQEVVREELRVGKGTQFDPLFAEIMISLIEEDTEYQMREH